MDPSPAVVPRARALSSVPIYWARSLTRTWARAN